MNRSKRKGTSFETSVCRYLADETGLDVERRALGGTNDRGDVSGVVVAGERAVLECKATRQLNVADFLRQAETERANDGAGYGFVVWKRPGVGAARIGETAVIMRLQDLAKLINKTK